MNRFIVGLAFVLAVVACQGTEPVGVDTERALSGVGDTLFPVDVPPTGGDSTPDFPSSVQVTGRVLSLGSGADSLPAIGVPGVSLHFVRMDAGGTGEQHDEGFATTDAEGAFTKDGLPGGLYIVTPILPPNSAFIAHVSYLAAVQEQVTHTVYLLRKP